MKSTFSLIFSALLCIGCAEKSQTEVALLNGDALGTSYRILYQRASTQNIANDTILTKGLDSIFKAVNTSLSTYQSDSDIRRIQAGDTTIVVDAMFRAVFALSKKIHKNTKGYFDPTVGKMVNAWGFGPQKHQLEMTESTVDSLMQYVGLSKVQLTKEYKIKKTSPEVYLDFNAIAKGYCIDRIGVYLEQQQIGNYLIELGGELLAKGTKAKEVPWLVGVDDPNQKEQRSLITTLELKDSAMATSGNYRKFKTDSLGNKFVHIVDATTGYNKPTNILSASVIAPNCATADAYATAFMAMPLQMTTEIVQADSSLETYIVYINEDKALDTFISKGFQELINTP